MSHLPETEYENVLSKRRVQSYERIRVHLWPFWSYRDDKFKGQLDKNKDGGIIKA